MQTKLTLTVNQAVIRRAKAYAQARNKSVSKLVEEYLSNLSGQANTSGALLEHTPITKRLTGKFVDLDNKQDYKDLLEAALLEKQR
jgi:Family of unknown function (DUF6364)